tara:strand:- start:643 stop:1230 length:588 start_codon:yes stop_codon:yes gene_type:complete
MADKGKDKNREDDQESAQALTPEDRINKLEKDRLISRIFMGVLLFAVIGLTSTLIYNSTQGPDPLTSENSRRLESIQQEMTQLKTALEATQTYNDNAQRLEGKLDRIIATIELNNFTVLRKLMVGQEASYQQFITALQQGMYDISRMVKGSRTWYEVYKEDLNLVIRDSKEREQQLNKGVTAPLKREIVTDAKQQ